MNRGTVMSLNRRTAIVLMPDGQFVSVKRQARFQIGDEITEFPLARAVPRIRQRLLQAGAAVSMLLLVLVGFLVFRAPPVVAYVTMDINPSIELGLDAKERVRELRAINKEAEGVIEGLKYRGRELETVMNEIARRLIDDKVLTEDDREVMIASVPVKAVKSTWENDVTNKMTNILNEAAKREQPPKSAATLEVTTVSVPAEVRDEANKNGISSGQMAFWLVSKSKGHEVSMETLKSKSLKDIAASWGGVNKVMSKGKSDKSDKDDDDDKDDHNDKDDQVKKDGRKENDDSKAKNGKNDKIRNNDNNGVKRNDDKRSNGLGNRNNKDDDKEKRNDSGKRYKDDSDNRKNDAYKRNDAKDKRSKEEGWRGKDDEDDKDDDLRSAGKGRGHNDSRYEERNDRDGEKRNNSSWKRLLEDSKNGKSGRSERENGRGSNNRD